MSNTNNDVINLTMDKIEKYYRIKIQGNMRGQIAQEINHELEQNAQSFGYAQPLRETYSEEDSEEN